MKVFFIGSLLYEKEFKEAYEKIFNFLDGKGIKLFSLSLGKNQYNQVFSDEKINRWGKSRTHNEYLKYMFNYVDCVVVESSKSSFRIGYEANIALNSNKPVLVMANGKNYEDFTHNPRFYGGNYKDLKNMITILDDFVETVFKEHLSIRRNIYITPNQSNFLNQYAKKNDISASRLIRDYINKLIFKSESSSS